MGWLSQNFQWVIILLMIGGPLIGRAIKAVAEQREAALRRAAARQEQAERGLIHPAEEQPVISVEQRQRELAARRQAQLEMWRAREAAARSEAATPTVVRGGTADPSGSDAARRRRAAMEELRRRQAEAQLIQQREREREIVRQRQQRERAGRQPVSRGDGRVIRPVERPREPDESQRAAQAAPGRRRVSSPAPTTSAPPAIPASRTTGRGAIFLTRGDLRRAIILKELLDPPLALRDGPSLAPSY